MLVAVAQVVLAELAGAVAVMLQDPGNRGILHAASQMGTSKNPGIGAAEMLHSS
jgi:hypothetical protein